MMSVANIVHNSAHAMTPTEVYVPGFLWGMSSVINKVHGVWRGYTKAAIYTNPKNFQSLVAGHVVNFAIGDNILVRIAAQCILIATRIFACTRQIIRLSKAYQRMVCAFKGDYPSPRTAEWSTEGTSRCCSPSTCRWIKGVFWGIIERIKRIAVSIFCLFKELFKLSMRFMDAIESFSLSPATQNEAINEMFVNGTSFLDELVKHQELLLDCLNDQKSLVTRILTGVGSQYTIDTLIDTITRTLEVTENVQGVVNAGNGVLKDIFKHAAFGFLAGVGMARHVPLSIVPDTVPQWAKTNEEQTARRNRPISAATLRMMEVEAPNLNKPGRIKDIATGPENMARGTDESANLAVSCS